MEHIIVIDASTCRAVIKKRRLSEGPEAAFHRIAHEEEMSVDDCEWQEIESVSVHL